MSNYTTLTELISNYSPSGMEKAAVNYLVRRMSDLGFTKTYSDNAGNAVGIMGNGKNQLVLLGHIDTVPGEIPIRIEDGYLFGRGSVDAKAPLACFVDAVSQVGIIDDWQFVVIGAVEEERNSEGARFVTTQYKPKYAIIGEPNHWDRVALGYKGSAWAELTIRREQSHSAHSEESACETIINLWGQIKNFTTDYNADKKKIFDQILLTIRQMDSGSDEFEQWAKLQIGARLPIEINPDDWYKILEQIAGSANISPIGFSVPAFVCEKNSILVRSMIAGIRECGGNPNFVFKTGTADLNIVAPQWKCPAVVYGPGDSAMDHTPNENINLLEFEKAVQTLTASIKILVTKADKGL